MLLWLAQFFKQDLGVLRLFNFITFRAIFATITAMGIGLAAGPVVIRWLTRIEGRAGGAHRWPANPSGQIRHADHGRRADTGGHWHFDLAVGGLVEPLCLGGAGRDTGLWRDWLGGRLSQGREQGPEWHALAGKIFLAVADRRGRLYLSGILRGGTECNDQVWPLFVKWIQSGFSMDISSRTDLIVPFFKNFSIPLGIWGFHGADVFRDRRHQQCGEPDRRTGWAGDHAHGVGGCGIGELLPI